MMTGSSKYKQPNLPFPRVDLPVSVELVALGEGFAAVLAWIGAIRALWNSASPTSTAAANNNDAIGSTTTT
jgi:hypothetical protein